MGVEASLNIESVILTTRAEIGFLPVTSFLLFKKLKIGAAGKAAIQNWWIEKYYLLEIRNIRSEHNKNRKRCRQ